ncbi:3-oxoadipate enol-lactonase, partial [Pseudomonas aeruginosa]
AQRTARVLQAAAMSETAAVFLGSWFPPALLGRAEPFVARFRAMLMATHRHGLAGSFAAVRDTVLRAHLARIERPTLVIAGSYDTVTAAKEPA